jgi:hypothetical protein
MPRKLRKPRKNTPPSRRNKDATPEGEEFRKLMEFDDQNPWESDPLYRWIFESKHLVYAAASWGADHYRPETGTMIFAIAPGNDPELLDLRNHARLRQARGDTVLFADGDWRDDDSLLIFPAPYRGKANTRKLVPDELLNVFDNLGPRGIRMLVFDDRADYGCVMIYQAVPQQ